MTDNFKIATLRGIVNELKIANFDFDKEERREIIEEMDSEDFCLNVGCGEYRFIHEDEIDDIMKEELSSDTYILGCFRDSFIASITGLSFEAVESAQKNESYELLGELMLQNIDSVVSDYVSLDGYGHHFSHYDGDMYEVGEYLVFRTN